ncbi:hypothetical protein [Pendulispora albinea]|uniref:Hydrazine synthase alpha subunit middle domain-containing protein n=1 Tax=Pendulispora albinea TaxID=2741071 RepID=A0ABZ2LXG6_9BACT
MTVVCAGLALLPAACSKEEPAASSYFDRSIAPILTTSCVRTNTGAGCHVATPKGNAFGNLDTSTFEGVDRRRDLLADYGPYGQPAFLVKNIPDFQIEVRSFDGARATVTTDIKHAGGPILTPTASAYQTLRRWIQNGATKNNAGAARVQTARLPCSTFVPQAPGFDPAIEPARADFATFRDKVNPTIRRTCAAANCHGTAANDLYLTCGDTDQQMRWNYFAAAQYLAQTPEQSEIARRPLAPSQGGAFHEGGILFESASDPDYTALLDWAREHGPPDFGPIEPNFAFFAHRVQPMLVKKGCMMLACHSAAQFHDYRLRGGSGGSFSFVATRRNYDLSLAQLSLESEDVRASRLVRKNLFRPELGGTHGIVHRGGALFEDFSNVSGDGGAPADLATVCDATNPKYNYDTDPLDKIPAYCMIREWHARERTERAKDERKFISLEGIVYVRRPIASGPDKPQDFDEYKPGAELILAKATVERNGDVKLADTLMPKEIALHEKCGLNSATADIRRPAVSWDGKRIAFAARSSQGEPLQIYELNAADGSDCKKHAAINATPPSANGLLIHNFDPAYSPPDGTGRMHLVFASTRGNLNDGAYDYRGPQRTPANPAKPNANLYDLTPDGAIRQLTYNLNLERHPTFMQDGRIIFTAEKRAPDFYQLALRRINIDGGDYHPLFAQRGSIGFPEASQVVELADKNFAAIFSDPKAAHGGGALGIFNRSVGIDFTSTNLADYPIDPQVLDPAAPSSPEGSFFLRSLRFVTSGKGDPRTAGVYRSPAILPNGKVLVSFGGEGADPAAFGGDYDLYVVDPIREIRTRLLGESGKAEIDAVAVFGRASRGLFASSLDEPNGFTTMLPGRAEADVHVLDMPVLATLLFQNTPTGRLIDDGLRSFEIFEELPPPLDMASFGAGGPNVAKDAFGQVFVKRRKLGDVPLASDGSAHFQVPGGLPILFKLPATATSQARKYPQIQRETMVFGPGEYAHQSFKRNFFDGLCAGCHGAVSGRAIDAAVQPDILTQASDTVSRGSAPTNLNLPPSSRGPVEGP